MHYACRSFIGKSTPTVWSQYWENEPDNPALTKNKGHLFGLISFSLVSETDTVTSLGHQYIDDLSQSYFNSDSESILAALENTINDFISRHTLQADFSSIILAATHRNQIYFATYNLNQIIICRQGKISRLLQGQTDQVAKLSGPLQTGDMFLLLSQSFFETINWTTIKDILSESSLPSIEENFLSSLYSLPESQGMAGALIQVYIDDPDPVQTTDVVPDIPDFEQTSTSFPVLPSTNLTAPPPAVPTQFVPPKPKKNILAKLFKPKGVFVDQYQSRQFQKRKRLNLFIALLLLFALGFSAVYGYQKNQAVKAETKYQTLKQDLDKKINDASAIKNLSFDASLQLARQAESIYDQMVLLQLHQDELPVYKDKISKILSKTGSSTDFVPESFYDTSLITDNPAYTRMIAANNSLLLLDSDTGRIDSVEISRKATKNLLKSDSAKNAVSLVASSDTVYLISENSIHLVSKNTADQKFDLTKVSPAINIVDSQIWNGALYLLDADNSTIWKLAPNSSGFGQPQNWIENEKIAETVTSMAINGDIWVLAQNGKITPYTRGTPKKFNAPVETQLTSARNLVTTLQTGYLAFTEADNIVYVINKNSEAKGKYNMGSIKIADIAIDESGNQLFILGSDQKIYRISLE